MILTDSHLHTDLSPDGEASMEAMIRASKAAGMGYICFTDHCDTVDWDTLSVTDKRMSVFPAAQKNLAGLTAAGALPEGIEVRLGLEVGEAHFAPELARRFAAQPGLDLVLGSVHILKDEGDFYFIKYRDPAHCEEVFDVYMDELLNAAGLDFFDICGHIGYPCRYMRRMGFDVDIMSKRYYDRLRQLLETIIKNGRGIELNCSGAGTGGGPFPVPEVLRLYKELGGELITIGSDAHRPENAGHYIREGLDLLHELGYKYIALFRNRQPEYLSI